MENTRKLAFVETELNTIIFKDYKGFVFISPLIMNQVTNASNSITGLILVVLDNDAPEEGDLFFDTRDTYNRVYECTGISDNFCFSKEINHPKERCKKIIASSLDKMIPLFHVCKSCLAKVVDYYNFNKKLPDIELDNYPHARPVKSTSQCVVLDIANWVNPESINETYLKAGIDITPSEEKCTCKDPSDHTCDYCEKQETIQIIQDAKKQASDIELGLDGWNGVSHEIKSFCDENNYTDKPLLIVMPMIIDFLKTRYESPKKL